MATQLQSLFLFLPFKVSLNLDEESTQVEHVPQVDGQIAETPSHVQRVVVDLLATQAQSLNILRPLFLIIRNRRRESLQLDGDATGELVGPDPDATGELVGTFSLPFPIWRL